MPGTSFDCDITIVGHPRTGTVALQIGPLDMGNLAEMLDWLGSQDGRDKIFDHAAAALMG